MQTRLLSKIFGVIEIWKIGDCNYSCIHNSNKYYFKGEYYSHPSEFKKPEYELSKGMYLHYIRKPRRKYKVLRICDYLVELTFVHRASHYKLIIPKNIISYDYSINREFLIKYPKFDLVEEIDKGKSLLKKGVIKNLLNYEELNGTYIQANALRLKSKCFYMYRGYKLNFDTIENTVFNLSSNEIKTKYKRKRVN